MPNLDIIYDVTTEVTWDERKTNKQVIYQTTSLPSFVTFDAFFFCLWPKRLSFERYLGGKALATDHRGDFFQLINRQTFLSKLCYERIGSCYVCVYRVIDTLGELIKTAASLVHQTSRVHLYSIRSWASRNQFLNFTVQIIMWTSYILSFWSGLSHVHGVPHRHVNRPLFLFWATVDWKHESEERTVKPRGTTTEVIDLWNLTRQHVSPHQCPSHSWAWEFWGFKRCMDLDTMLPSMWMDPLQWNLVHWKPFHLWIAMNCMQTSWLLTSLLSIFHSQSCIKL